MDTKNGGDLSPEDVMIEILSRLPVKNFTETQVCLQTLVWNYYQFSFHFQALEQLLQQYQ
jgi:hypothetical protein